MKENRMILPHDPIRPAAKKKIPGKSRTTDQKENRIEKKNNVKTGGNKKGRCGEEIKINDVFSLVSFKAEEEKEEI